MKQDIHPDYHYVVFQDTASDETFLTRSTATSSSTIEWEDGNTYPLVRVDISNKSHPFWTGTARIMDTAGQVEKFRKRYGSRTK
jgi:large subunit ribosomal protein L31